MKEELRFNWLDVFRAPRAALSLQKIWVLFVPLLVGYLFYLAFTFLGLSAAGKSVLQNAFATHGLLPCVMGVAGVTFWSYVLWIVGLVMLIASFLFGATAVARATFLELKGETFFTYRELYAFAKRHAKDAICGPLGILAVIIGIALCGVVLGLFGRIPYVGIIPVVGFSPIWFGITFFLVVLGIVFVFSLLLAPGITASTKGDFFEVITETFSAAFSEPYRLVWYEVVLLVVGGLALSILMFLVKLSYKLMVGIIAVGMGSSFDAVSAKASQVTVQWFPGIAGQFAGVGALGTVPLAEVTGYQTFWAYVLAVVAAVAGFIVWACYGSALLSAGNAIIYVVLHKIKDEEDLLELEEEEEEEKEEKEEAPGEPEKAEAPPEEEVKTEAEKAQEEAPEKQAEPESAQAEAPQPQTAGAPPEEESPGEPQAAAEVKEPEAGADDQEGKAAPHQEPSRQKAQSPEEGQQGPKKKRGGRRKKS